MQTEFNFTPNIPEEWRVCHLSKDYEVSSLGRLRNAITGRILRGTLHDCGYRNVGMTINGKMATKLLHRLVAEVFVTKPSPAHIQVNHINKNRDDCRACNLEWLTPSENMIHSWNGRRTADKFEKVEFSQELCIRDPVARKRGWPSCLPASLLGK